MAAQTDHHVVTEEISLPYVGMGLGASTKRALPVDAIYALKKSAETEDEQADAPEQKKASRGSMFFRGKNRNIQDDPFLQRLSRLK